MRILLDESLPRGLKGLLEGLDVVTVPEQGWQSMKNGELLRRASDAFDVFVTADQNLEHQQNIAVACAPTNTSATAKEDCEKAMEDLEAALLRYQGQLDDVQDEVDNENE